MPHTLADGVAVSRLSFRAKIPSTLTHFVRYKSISRVKEPRYDKRGGFLFKIQSDVGCIKRVKNRELNYDVGGAACHPP